MRPFYLFLLAILTPVLLMTSLLVPLYIGILGGCYLAYWGPTPHPLAEKLLDPFYILDVYSQLVTFLIDHFSTADKVKFMLPVMAVPIVGLFISVWLTRRLSRGMMNLFHLSASTS